MTSKTIYFLAAIVSLLATNCSAPLPSSQVRFERAKTNTEERYMQDGYRAQALGDWYWFDENKREGLSAKQKEWVDFGIGFLTFIDLLQGLPSLIDGLAGDNGGDGGLTLPADKIIQMVNSLHTEVIQKGLYYRFAAVAADTEFSANLNCNADLFPDTECPFRGNLDFGEIGLFAGVTGLLDALLNDLASHDKLLDFVIDLALNPPAVKEGSNPFRTLPPVLWQVIEDYAQREYGKTFSASDLWKRTDDGEKIRQQFVVATGLLYDGLLYTSQESSNQDDEVFPEENYISSILERVVGVTDASVLTVLSLAEAGRILTVDRLATEVAAVQTSLIAAEGDSGQYFLSPFLTEVLTDIKGILPFALPPSLADMHLPAIWLGGLFTSVLDKPMLLLPATRGKSFLVDYEQEDYSATDTDIFFRTKTDGSAETSYKDTGFSAATSTGSSLLIGANNGIFDDLPGFRLDKDFVGNKTGIFHQSPLTSVTELPNNWVDPVYLFWPDPGLGGVLVPTVQNKVLEVDATGVFDNASLNGFVSAILAIVQDATAP